MPEKEKEGELPHLVQFTVTKSEAHFLMGLIAIGDAIHDHNEAVPETGERLTRYAHIFSQLLWRGDELPDNIDHGSWHSLRSKAITAFAHADPTTDRQIQEIMAYARKQRAEGDLGGIADLFRQIFGEDNVIEIEGDEEGGPAAEARKRDRKDR